MSGAAEVLSGIKAALTGGEPGRHMDLSRGAFKQSFYALAVAGFLILASLFALSGGAAPMPVPILLISLTLFFLTAPTVIYLVSHLLSQTDLFRPWVIVRNWTMLLISIAALVIAFIGRVDFIPARPIMTALMLLYLGTLLVDIRLAQTMAKMDWTPAIFIACAISISGMLILLAVFAGAAGY